VDIKPDFDEARYRQLMAPLIDGSRDHLTFNTVHRHREGFDIPVEVFLQHVRLPGGEARMIITSRDIRAQIDVQASLYRLARGERARAAELNAVIQGMSDGVLVCDADGRVVLANQAAAAILGDGIEGYAAIAAMMEPDGPPLPPLGTTSPPVEARLRGQPRWIELGSAVVPGDPADPVDAPATTVLVVRDITSAREAQAAREAFIGVLSHEMRTPITTIYGNTKVMRRVSDVDVRQDMLRDVETEADRLYRLVEDLLILSRAETGLRIGGVLASERARWPGHRFVDRLATGLPPVIADRTYLEQVIRNLVTNAAKYGRQGGTVTLEAESLESDGGAVAVRVLDEGEGVPDGEEERVFELFYRSDATSRRASGAGIGLYVCRLLVEGMGGRIWTRRRPGGGGEFGFTVPALAPDEDDVPPVPDDDEYVAIDTGGGSGRPLD
jgi:signal transduction histidine kinase